MEDSPGWQPTLIDIESGFARLVPTFRNGQIVRDLMPDRPSMKSNADYYFPDDCVIVEIKCMQADAREVHLERPSARSQSSVRRLTIIGFLIFFPTRLRPSSNVKHEQTEAAKRNDCLDNQ